MSVKLGNTAISKLYLGANEVTKAYLGATEVFSSASNGLLNNLEYYYRANGDLTDEIASADGTNYGATYTSGGTPEGAYTFDGVNDYATFPHSSITATNNFTMNFWYKYEGGSLIYIKTFKWDGSSSDLSGAGFYHTGSQTWFRKCTSNSSIQDTKFTDTTLNDGSWHMITVTQSSTEGCKVYVDTTLVKTESGFTSAMYVAGANTSAWGANFDEPSTHNNHSNVSIGGDGFWSEVLSSDKITALYNAGAGLDFADFTS